MNNPAIIHYVFLSFFLIFCAQIKFYFDFSEDIIKIFNFQYFQPKIFSAFTYKSESYMLAFQIKYLYPLISKFVLVFSNISFTGNPLPPPSFQPFDNFLKPFFENKTIFLYEADMTNKSMCSGYFYYDIEKNKPTFHRKCILTSYILPAVKAAGIRENDFFFYSDVDEFPTYEAVCYLMMNPPKRHVHAKCLFFYHFTFRWSNERDWIKLVYIRYTKQLKNSDIVELRYRNLNVSKSNDVRMIHMSSNFQTIQQFRLKVNSYCATQAMDYYGNKNDCDMFIQIIKTLIPNSTHYHKNNYVFPNHILNDPSLSILFSPYPIDELYKYFINNCPKQKNSTLFNDFIRKINESSK